MQASRYSCCKLFPIQCKREARARLLFKTLTIYWHSAQHLHTQAPSIIPEEEQCMDVEHEFPGEDGFESIFLAWQFICHPPQPEERLLPPWSLIKQERINNRCLRRGDSSGKGGEGGFLGGQGQQ